MAEKILIAEEKHGNRYISLHEGIDVVASLLLKERITAEYYTGGDLDKARRALIMGASWKFLHSRKDREYEFVKIEPLEGLS